MRISDIFSAATVAANRTEVESNKIPFLGESFFPNRKKVGLDLKWIKTHKGLNAILAPSNFDAIPVIRNREGFKIESTQMIFFRESMHVKEEDMMEMARIQDSNDPYIASVLDDIYDDTNTLIDAADIAAEAMRMQLLATASGTPQISIGTKDNTIYTYNYDPDGTYAATHYVALSGNAQWKAANAATAKPLTDINTGVQYLRSIGANPKYALMNSVTFNALADITQIANALVTISGTAVSYIDNDAVRDVFVRKTGLTPLIYDKQYLNYAGQATKFYPDDQVTIIGDEQLGYLWRGTTPEERTLMGDPSVNVSVLDRGVAVAVKTEAGPPVRIITSVSQLALPSYEGMDSTYVIKTA